MTKKPAAQERMGSRADNFVLGKPPADAFGVALQAARQWGIEGVAFVRFLAITLSGPNYTRFWQATNLAALLPACDQGGRASRACTNIQLVSQRCPASLRRFGRKIWLMIRRHNHLRYACAHTLQLPGVMP